MSNYGSYSGGSKTARNAWIIVAVIAVLAIIAVAVVIIIANTNAPAPSPTDKPTIQPTNSPTGSSTSTPTVTPTPSPTSTATPTPTPTASPSASGSTSPKPNPTTPSPTPTIDPAVAWANSLYGTFSPLTASGQGNSHVAVPKGVKGALLTVTNNGADDQDFRVEVYNQFGKPMSTLVDVQGDYQGTVAYGLNSQIGATPTTILITSSGNWSVEFAPVSTASMELGSGTSNDVILYPGDAGPLTVQSLTSGDFSLTTFSGSNPTANVLTTQTGWWTGTVDLPDGPLVLVVSSNGAWNLQFGFVTQ